MIFVDDSFILALLDKDHEAHSRAKFHLESIRSSAELLVVISPVLASLVTVHNVSLAQQTKLGKFLQDLLKGKVDNFIYKKGKGERDFMDAFALALEPKTVHVSFTGAAIMQAMQKHPNSWLLTYDKPLAEAAKTLGLKVLN